MARLTNDDLIIAGLATAGIGLMLMPLFGLWTWPALALGLWMAHRCLNVLDLQ